MDQVLISHPYGVEHCVMLDKGTDQALQHVKKIVSYLPLSGIIQFIVFLFPWPKLKLTGHKTNENLWENCQK